MPTDGQTNKDLMNLTVPCRNFAEFPKFVNKLFENVTHFTFSDMKRANQNCIIGEIKCKLDQGMPMPSIFVCPFSFEELDN